MQITLLNCSGSTISLTSGPRITLAPTPPFSVEISISCPTLWTVGTEHRLKGPCFTLKMNVAACERSWIWA